MKLAWGRFAGGIGADPLLGHEPALGRRLARVHRDRGVAREHLRASATGPVGDYVFKLVFIWISIGVAIVSLRYGKWIPNLGAFLRVVVLGFFSITVVVYGDQARRSTASRRGDAVADARGLHRARPGAALQLRRLRAPERRGRGDGEPAARRAALRAAQRRSLGVLMLRRSRSSASCSCCRSTR